MTLYAPMATPTSTSTSASTTTEDFAVTLARFATGVSTRSLPGEVVEAVKMNVLDTLACAVAGSSAHSATQARELASEWGGAPQATILGYGDRVPAHHAAWVNGTMSHARDYDDTHDAAVLHAGVSVVPAALAAAELRGATPGAVFIAGVAAGLETICRLGVATRISIVDSGWIYTPLFGHFAATVAAARVLELSIDETVNALGITYSQACGNHQVTRDGAHTKSMQPGFAAQAALMSVQLTRKQVRGAQASFDGADGFLRVYLRGQCDGKALRDRLGERFEMLQLSYKPYPCCRLTHTSIDAAISLRGAAGFDASRIRRIRVGVNRQSYEAVCTPVEVRKAPQTLVQAQFSIPYTVAAASIDGTVGLAHFSGDAALARADVRALAQRVECHVDEDIEREWGRNVTPAHLVIELDDGSTRSARVDLPPGHPSRPMSEREQQAKVADCFRAAARPLGDAGPDELRRLVLGLESLDDVSALARALVPAA
jgi:2-methylcitrate dehydratase PrpD